MTGETTEEVGLQNLVYEIQRFFFLDTPGVLDDVLFILFALLTLLVLVLLVNLLGNLIEEETSFRE